ncbi:hypothetical protein GUJ93_ZPchr0014g47429 [Zizania palustris]|uniref:Uncharacterized protein n=1 Tax=Zizania palustris TaxID=103762 RepID=A0A8J5VSF1_ZIZPA|nr:hypothetical protein GUJ93_ZPchr0014g47429 [Zizania palustris]
MLNALGVTASGVNYGICPRTLGSAIDGHVLRRELLGAVLCAAAWVLGAVLFCAPPPTPPEASQRRPRRARLQRSSQRRRVAYAHAAASQRRFRRRDAHAASLQPRRAPGLLQPTPAPTRTPPANAGADAHAARLQLTPCRHRPCAHASSGQPRRAHACSSHGLRTACSSHAARTPAPGTPRARPAPAVKTQDPPPKYWAEAPFPTVFRFCLPIWLAALAAVGSRTWAEEEGGASERKKKAGVRAEEEGGRAWPESPAALLRSSHTEGSE